MKKKLKILSLEETEIWKNYTQNFSHKNSSWKTGLLKEAPKAKKANDQKLSKSIYKNQLDRYSSSDVSKTLIDKKLYLKLKKGRVNPERTLDLHGLNYDMAHFRAKKFIFSSYKDGFRLLLIITGKGKATIEEQNFFHQKTRGIIKQAFPIWLECETLKHLVLNVTTAHSSHGGNGAYYVYLRKMKTYNT